MIGSVTSGSRIYLWAFIVAPVKCVKDQISFRFGKATLTLVLYQVGIKERQNYRLEMVSDRYEAAFLASGDEGTEKYTFRMNLKNLIIRCMKA